MPVQAGSRVGRDASVPTLAWGASLSCSVSLRPASAEHSRLAALRQVNRTGTPRGIIRMNESDQNRERSGAAKRGNFPGFALPKLAEDIRGGHSSQSKSCGWPARHPKQLIICLFFLGLFQGCGSGGPEGEADRFMDAYYAAADLGAALNLADGLAAKKIRDQLQLNRGETGPQTSQGRRVSYTRMERNTVEGKLFFRYEVRIDIQGAGSLIRKTLLAMQHGPNGWRVTNFTDTD